MGSLRQVAVTLAGIIALAADGPRAGRPSQYGTRELQPSDSGQVRLSHLAGSISWCTSACVHVNAIAMPVAKAFNYAGDAQLVNGRYTLTVDVPDGLRCDNIYYGPTIPTHDVYTWDATTLAGSLDSSFDAGCDGAPGGTRTYPFTLSNCNRHPPQAPAI